MFFEDFSLRKHEDILFYILFAFGDTSRQFSPSSRDYGYDSLLAFDNTRMSCFTWIRTSANVVNQFFLPITLFWLHSLLCLCFICDDMLFFLFFSLYIWIQRYYKFNLKIILKNLSNLKYYWFLWDATLKIWWFVNTESSSAFNAYVFHLHQPLRAIYCLVNLQAITFLLLYCHIKWFCFILFLCVSSQCHYHLTEMSLILVMPTFPVFLYRITSLRKLELETENKIRITGQREALAI